MTRNTFILFLINVLETAYYCCTRIKDIGDPNLMGLLTVSTGKQLPKLQRIILSSFSE
jgi:hypothetical protein